MMPVECHLDCLKVLLDMDDATPTYICSRTSVIYVMIDLNRVDDIENGVAKTVIHLSRQRVSIKASHMQWGQSLESKLSIT